MVVLHWLGHEVAVGIGQVVLGERWLITSKFNYCFPFLSILVENSSKIGLANKDRKNRPMQQEDEYRIQMELNRYYLRKDSLSAGVSSEQSFYETESARTPSSRGKQLKHWLEIPMLST